MVATAEWYHQAEAASYLERANDVESGEWRVAVVCLFVVLLLAVEGHVRFEVFADGRSDVLGKWRSGGRQGERAVNGTSIEPRRYGQGRC